MWPIGGNPVVVSTAFHADHLCHLDLLFAVAVRPLSHTTRQFVRAVVILVHGEILAWADTSHLKIGLGTFTIIEPDPELCSCAGFLLSSHGLYLIWTSSYLEFQQVRYFEVSSAALNEVIKAKKGELQQY